MNDQTHQSQPMTPDRFRLTLYRLVLDWIHLTTAFPSPLATGSSAGRRATSRIYGHPAEWASDTAALIATTLNGWHDTLADHLHETPPPPPSAPERVRILAAWRYLEPRVEQLLALTDTADDPAASTEIGELHHRIRWQLGHTRPRHTLPIPCPNTDCGLKTLQRTTGVGQDMVVCAVCGYTVKDAHYPLLIRITLDTLIDPAA